MDDDLHHDQGAIIVCATGCFSTGRPGVLVVLGAIRCVRGREEPLAKMAGSEREMTGGASAVLLLAALPL